MLPRRPHPVEGKREAAALQGHADGQGTQAIAAALHENVEGALAAGALFNRVVLMPPARTLVCAADKVGSTTVKAWVAFHDANRSDHEVLLHGGAGYAVASPRSCSLRLSVLCWSLYTLSV